MIQRFAIAVAKLHLCRPIKILDSGVDQTSWRIMGFYSENRAEYVIGMLACFKDSITVMPVSSKPTDLSISQQIMEHSLIEVLCVSRITLTQILSILNNEGLPNLKTIICFDKLSEAEINNLIPSSRQQEIQILLFSSLIDHDDNLNDQHEDIQSSQYCNIEDSMSEKIIFTNNRPQADTIFLVMYTSGTRNELKGCMLTHRNLLSGFSNMDFYGY